MKAIDLFKKYSFLFIILLIISCNRKTDSIDQATSSSFNLKYAKGFFIREEGKSLWLTVKHPYPDATIGYEYLLVRRGDEIPPHPPSVQVVEIPIRKIVCTSTTHIPMLNYLGETKSLVAFPTLDYISSEPMRKRINAGEVAELGIDKEMNLELLFSLKPELVMGYTMTKDLGQLKKIQELGIPVVINAEYLEQHPLGRAEWIKFVGLFYDRMAVADSVFKQIESSYLETQSLVNDDKIKPKVFSGIMYGDGWFMPGGNNYAARLFKDAGLHYLWRDTNSNGFLSLSFEAVLLNAKQADLWIGAGSFNSLAELSQADNRYGLFSAYTREQVFNYNARMGAKGGNEYLELGYLRPDLILKDLVKIGHPDKLPKHELFFYKQLK